MAAVRPDVDRIWRLNRRLEQLYSRWQELEPQSWHRGYVGVTDFRALIQRHVELAGGFDDETLKAKIAANADLLEAIAVLIFAKASRTLGDVAPDETTKIDPYAVGLDPDRWEADGLFDGSGMTIEEARASPAGGMRACSWRRSRARPDTVPAPLKSAAGSTATRSPACCRPSA